VAIGWGYLISILLIAPKKKMEDRLTSLTNDIIHELNIPLSTITANTAMLKKGNTDEKSLTRIGRIEDASVRLKKLYDELVYTIRKEMHPVEKERLDLKDLVEARVEVFREQKRNPIEVTIESYKIEVDKIGFEQMLDNIITNAMKYSDKTSPVKIVLEGDVLSIEDSGEGMSETELLRVHERYYQADEKKDGKGIGLALVKAYCDEADIQIQIRSEKGVSTTVSLELSKIEVKS
jgi:signal transduction histidine kinase